MEKALTKAKDHNALTTTDLIDAGFAFEKVIKIGDPKGGEDVIGVYAGRLKGPGGDIEVNAIGDGTGSASMPTWQFNPLNPKTLQPETDVIHTVICSHQLDRACAGAYSLALEKNQVADMLMRWKSIDRIQGGKKSVNTFDIAIRHTDKPVKKGSEPVEVKAEVVR